jgi:hypothetical protein
VIILQSHNLAFIYLVSFYVVFLKKFSHFSLIDVTTFNLKLWFILCAACGTVWNRIS